MFDLNIDVCLENPAYNGGETASGELSGTFQATEVSGTSDSSVVNVDHGLANFVAGDGDRDSDYSTSALKFDLFKKLRTSTAEVVPDDDENDVDDVAGSHGPPEFVTWQLFLVDGVSSDGGGRGMNCDSEFGVGSSETQWLNLSVSGSASGSSALEQSEMRTPPPLQQQQVRRSRRGPRSRSSQYRGVTFYRRTGRWESHIWDCGKQVYLGGFDTAYAAARAYDRAAIKFRGVDADINFTISDYDEDVKQMKNLTKEELVQTLRRQCSGFPRGSSRYRGAALQKYGRWEGQMGQYLGTKAYHNGREVVTNVQPSNYEMRMPVDASNGELGHNLDLNLGISNSVDVPRGSKYVGKGNPYPHSPLYHNPADGRRNMIGSSYWLPSGHAFSNQPLPSSQSSMWPGVPGISPIHVERGTQERQHDTVPSSRLSNRAWNAQGGHHGGANQVVPLFSSTQHHQDSLFRM